MNVVAFLAASIAVSSAASTWSHVDGGDWSPDAQVIAPLKDEVRAEYDRNVIAYEKDHGTRHPTWSDYSFQYQGIVWEGKKVVFVNAYCRRASDPGFDATKRMLIVADGGPCYFHVLYEPSTHTFYKFGFNGVA